MRMRFTRNVSLGDVMPDTFPWQFAPTKILVPTDFSPSAVAAVHAATGLAEQFHAEIYLLHAIPMLSITTGIEFPTTFYPAEEFLEEARDGAKRKLQEMVSLLSDVGIEANYGIEVGNDVVGNILMVMRREKTDLLVISTHGMSGWHPMVFGSIAEKVVKLVECPLLLLRSIKPTAIEPAAKS
jgi:nucleotide-binding universal stress UspA family protein